MAKETSFGFLPGSDPDAMKANLDYQEALARMQEALDARKNRMFDPEMLALASGFLAPTQTGGFGESLGYAAKNMREAQMQQEKEEREIAQAQLGLAGKGLELERMRQRDRQFESMMGPQGAPKGALPTGAPEAKGALPAPPKGFEGTEGIPVAPPNPSFMTGRQYLGMARMDPSISPTAAMKEAQKMEMDRYQVREGGVQDLASGMYYPFPKGETVKRQIFGYSGEFNVDARTAALLDMYAANGDPRYYDLAKRVVEGPKAPPKPGEKVAGAEGERMKSATEVEAERAAATESAKERAKAQEDERKRTIEAGSDAASRIGTYRQLERIASGPNAKAIFGIFERPGVFEQIGKLVESGIGNPKFTVGVPAIREIMTNAGLPQNLIDQSQLALSLMANVQLQMSRLQQGQGAVSDYERQLFGQAAITKTDNPQTILAKLDLLRARAEFDREVSKAARGYKGNIDDFKLSPEYERMVSSYEDKLGAIIDARLSGSITPPARSRPSGGRDNQGAASRLPV
jgi:hypothetical protein